MKRIRSIHHRYVLTNEPVFSTMTEYQAKKEQFTLLLDRKQSVFVSKKDRRKEKNRSDSWFYLGYVGQIGFAIAIPIVAGVMIGSYTGHKVLGLGLGIVISFFGFVKTIQEIIKRK